jgi:hypothetical protein
MLKFLHLPDTGNMPWIITDEAAVSELIDKIKPTHLMHPAGVSAPPDANADPKAAWATDLFGTINVARAGDSDQREQGIAPGIGRGGAHPIGSSCLGGWTDRPVRRHPFAGCVD